MKAIQLEKPGQFRTIEIAEPNSLGRGDALVRVHRVGICGTDFSGYLGKRRGEGRLEGDGQLADIFQRDVLRPAFDIGDTIQIHAGAFRERLAGDTGAAPPFFDHQTQSGFEAMAFHDGFRTRFLEAQLEHSWGELATDDE